MFLFPRCKTCLVFLRKVHRQAGVDCNYYKILGVNPSATQAEIKTAYFELSKKHHPDRNQGSEESAEIFRLVKAAYEVLGSEKKRLQYDKERIFNTVRRPTNSFHHTDNGPDYRDDAERMHYQSRARPPFRKFYQGRTTYYDFDAWFEGHYGKNSFNEDFRERSFENRQYRFYDKYDKEQTKNVILTKLKNTAALIFYLAILLSGLRFNNASKKG